jgi:hypothetical protein
VVVADPFGNGLVLDLSKGCYQTGTKTSFRSLGWVWQNPAV